MNNKRCPRSKEKWSIFFSEVREVLKRDYELRKSGVTSVRLLHTEQTGSINDYNIKSEELLKNLSLFENMPKHRNVSYRLNGLNEDFSKTVYQKLHGKNKIGHYWR